SGRSVDRTTHRDRLCRDGGMPNPPLSVSPGSLCQTLSRSDLHVTGSNELKRNLTCSAPFKQVFDRAGELLVKRNRAFRFDMKTRQVTVLDVPDLCLGVPRGPDGDALTHLATPVLKHPNLT